MKKTLTIVSIGWWLGVGLVVLNHNLAPFRGAPFVNQTLRWNNLSRSTPHFSWHQVPTLKNGRVALPAKTSQRFSVTLPRGFRQGEIFVAYKPNLGPADQVTLRAEVRPGQEAVTTTSDTPLWLIVNWEDLQFRGHTTDFQLTNEMEKPISLTSIRVIVR